MCEEEWPQHIGRSCWDLLSLNTITATVAPPLTDSVSQLDWVSSEVCCTRDPAPLCVSSGSHQRSLLHAHICIDRTQTRALRQ